MLHAGRAHVQLLKIGNTARAVDDEIGLDTGIPAPIAECDAAQRADSFDSLDVGTEPDVDA